MITMSDWLATFVLNAAWQITAITAIVMLSSRWLRRAPSRYAHAAWVAALAGCLLVPLMTLLIQTREAGHNAAASGIPLGPSAAESSQSAKGGVPFSFHSLSHSLSFPPLLIRALFGAYLSLLAWRAIQLGWAAYRTFRISRCASHCPIPPSLARTAEHCRQAFSLSPVPMLRAREGSGPATIGIRRPLLILPESFFEGRVAEVDLLCALSHEFAHIRRHDFLLNLLYELMYVPVCFHPGAALVMARIARTRELACDEMAAQILPSPRQYARSLLQIARSIFSEPRQKLNYGLGLFDTNILEERVMNILATTKTDWEWTRTRRWTAVCLVAAVCLSLSAFSLRVTGGSSTAELERFVGTWQAKYNGKVFFTLRINSENGRLGGTCIHADRLAYVDGELIPSSDTMSTERIAEAQVSGQRLLLKIADDPSDTIPLEFRLTSNGGADVKILVESSSGTPAPKKPWHFERVSAAQ